jgi:hypothetical protein
MVSKSGNEVNATLVFSYVLLYFSIYILASFKTPQNCSFSQTSLEIYVADFTNSNIYNTLTKLNTMGLIIRSNFSKKEDFLHNRNT